MIIDSELKALIPPLKAHEYAQLEANILEHGCRDALVVWGETLIDGHNRHTICTEYDIPYKMTSMEFDNRQDVIGFMVNNQLGRRNLEPYQRYELVKHLEPALKEQAKQNQATSTGGDSPQLKDNCTEAVNTNKALAEAAGVSDTTIKRARFIDENADEETKQQLKSGETSINKVYTEIKKPHVSNNSGNNEWYTPAEYIEAARAVMGSINLDPASSEIANETVKADDFYAIDEDGLKQEWHGNVWLNPPYAQPLIGQFCDKLIHEYDEARIDAAIVLLNNSTETRAFQDIVMRAAALCMVCGRIKYNDSTGVPANTPLQGQIVLYFGDYPENFVDIFRGFGFSCGAR